MIVIDVKEHKDNLLAAGVKEKVIPVILRKALKKLALWVHKNMIPGHFDRSAYVKHRAVWPQKRHKRSPKRPLYITGTLQRNIMRNMSVRATGGAGRVSVKLVMRMGRPAQYTGRFLKAAVFKLMEETNLDYRQARRMIYSTFAYGARNVRNYEEKITHLTKTQKRKVAQMSGRMVADQLLKRARSGKGLLRAATYAQKYAG